ncbi:DUF5107 domain-containing protein [Microbacterium sp. LTA6]|uniref:DUF5107 domain-containing protein n=1 Tax=Microbacterium sp. LTA6 TaxID=3129771 RepID=UPI003244A228
MTTTIRQSVLTLSAGEIGRPGPFPPLEAEAVTRLRADATSVPDDIAARVAAAPPPWSFPYHPQSEYDRERRTRDIDVVVLENEHLRATIVPSLGGRIWSLVDVASGAELLSANKAFQPANLALRDAWFAGGVEFNIGMRGHSPTTCDPLHAAVVDGPGGAPGLRMWEFERARGLVFAIDVHLAHDSDLLAVHVRVVNPDTAPASMYWWTNIAVPETDGTRVIAASRTTYASDYSGRLVGIDAPYRGDIDITLPGQHPGAADYFFDGTGIDVPWITAIGEDGTGLLHASTARLVGRKLFCWGNGQGARRWQEWLSPEGGRYAEIQAGLAPTQFEYLEMPARAEWSWTEVFGKVRVDGAGPEHATPDAIQAADRDVQTRLSTHDIDALHGELSDFARRAPLSILNRGSGWGAVERALRRADQWIDETPTPFPVVEGDDSAPWNDLVVHGVIPPTALVGSHVRGDRWERHLRSIPGADADAFAQYHLGVFAHVAGDAETARAHLRASNAAAPSAAATRALGFVALQQGDAADAARRLRDAIALTSAGSPERAALILETLDVLRRAGDFEQVRSLAITALGDEVLTGSVTARVRLALVEAELEVGDRESAAALLRGGGILPANFREGEDRIAMLWQRTFGEKPPRELDFSMFEGAEVL